MYDDAMVDIDKLYPIENEKAQKIINPGLAEPHFAEINISRHCTKCHSGNVEKLRETKVEKDILVWYKCLECGNEEFMDKYTASDYDA